MTLDEFLMDSMRADVSSLKSVNALQPEFADLWGKQMLADFEAKRRIVELHEEGHSRSCAVDGETYPCRTLRLLAMPYAGHKDYREEWRP